LSFAGEAKFELGIPASLEPIFKSGGYDIDGHARDEATEVGRGKLMNRARILSLVLSHYRDGYSYDPLVGQSIVLVKSTSRKIG